MLTDQPAGVHLTERWRSCVEGSVPCPSGPPVTWPDSARGSRRSSTTTPWWSTTPTPAGSPPARPTATRSATSRVQFSVFSHQFVEAQLRKVINAADLDVLPGRQGDPHERAGRRLPADDAGSGVADGVDPDIVGHRGHGRRRAGSGFTAAHFEWLLRFGAPIGLGFDDMGKRRHGTRSTLFFCDELLRIYGSEDPSIAEGASYAVEHWAAAGFWKELIAGLSAFKARECPDLPLGFWTWHDKIEDQHAAHTADELAEAFFRADFDEDRFLAGAAEMLDGVKAFWDGLEADRLRLVGGDMSPEVGRDPATRVTGSRRRRPRPSTPPRLGGIDHIEFWVGNARTSAAFFASALGFDDRGLRRARDRRGRPGVLRPDAGRRPVRRHRRDRPVVADRGPRRRATATACTTSPSLVDNAAAAYGAATARGATGSVAPHVVVRRLRPHRAGQRRHLRRDAAHLRRARRLPRPVRPRLRGAVAGPPVGPAVGLTRSTTSSATSSSATSAQWVDFYARVFGFEQTGPLRRRHDLHRVLGADVDRGVGRLEGRAADQRAGRGPAQEPDRGVPRLLRRAGRAAHRPADRRHRDARCGPCGTAACGSSGAGRLLRRRQGPHGRHRPAVGGARATSASWSTATRTATCCRSSPRTSATGRRCSSRSSSGEGARGFGAGNFKALFEAIEREQARRGNL